MFNNRLKHLTGFGVQSKSSSFSQRLLIQRNTSSVRNTVPLKRPHHELSALTESTCTLSFRSIPYGSPPELIFGASGSIQFNHNSSFFKLRILQTSSRPSTISRTLSPSSPTSRPTPPPTLHHTTSPDSINPFLTKEEMRARQIGLKKFRKGYTMDLTIMISKKKVHKSAVVREQCKRRFKEAIRLVVMRGAYVEEGLVKFDQDKEGPRKWLVGGFSYVASGTLELFRCDFPTLVEQVRTALRFLKTKAENQIIEKQLAQIEAPPIITTTLSEIDSKSD